MNFLEGYAPEYKFQAISLYLKKYSSKEEFGGLVRLVFGKIFKFYSDARCFFAADLERQLVELMTDQQQRELVVDQVMSRLGEQKPENFKIVVRAAIFVAANWWMCEDKGLRFDLDENLAVFD